MKKNEEPKKEEIAGERPTSEESREQTVERDTSVEARLAELEQAVASYKDQLLRKAAEFENYKKRIENDFASIAKFSNEELIIQLLPVIDDLVRSLKMGKERQDYETFYRGIELIVNKFKKILETTGVEELQSVGKPFDVYYHDAMMEIPRGDLPHHTVLEEVEKGYTLHGKVIRHAKVILSAQESKKAGDSQVDDTGDTSPSGEPSDGESTD